MACLLAIETSAHVGAVALVDDASGVVALVGEAVVRDDYKLSSWLLPAIHRVLRNAGRDGATLDGIAFGAGPGSFTGVRTACATAQTLAWAWQKPLLTVDSLEALAHAAVAAGLADGVLTVALDARMGELYVASFQCAGNAATRITDTRLLPLAQAVTHVAATHRDSPRVLGSGAVLLDPQWALSKITLDGAESSWAHGVARVGLDLLATGRVTEPTLAEPLYVRNQVAQTEAERREARSATTVSTARRSATAA
ncbi:MAG: tRNA (adenosine(37)-N6)-threonylcarbamoyltransferase complex dimerization subunit type 1 TsaB [Burkholderiales bacterium]|nr:tRNA (adenosine(37)-N6)-threonylcarbamoyltransferase complex dimerization subunit type 1 TsaB [Burkholderiales bacterium]